MKPQKYLSKILLFGEYTVIDGSRALAIPYLPYSGLLEKTQSKDLVSLANYLKIQNFDFIDTQQFLSDAQNGLSFCSTIPQGQGLGSSGALCAAVYAQYKKKNLSWINLKNCLGKIEEFFHGKSSGLDPLVSYLECPLLVSQNNIQEVRLNSNLNSIFIFPTHKERKTAPLVHNYLKMKSETKFNEGVTSLVKATESLISDFLEGSDYSRSFYQVSFLQRKYLSDMIPENLRKTWDEGLEDKKFMLKLCGAGGGGVFLGHSRDQSLIEKKFPESQFLKN